MYVNTQMIFQESYFSNVKKMKVITLTAAILTYVMIPQYVHMCNIFCRSGVFEA